MPIFLPWSPPSRFATDERAATIALGLVSHTNTGKTTLARTLLGRDVGEVRDAPHVTEFADAWPMLETADGERLLLWDTPGFGDSARLVQRLEGSSNPLGWLLAQVWDRWRDRPFWSAQQAIRSLRDEADVMLYLVNAAESPQAAGYVEPEMALLGWIGKPVLVLLNQLGAPRPQDEEAAEVERWRAHLSGHPHVRRVLPLDAFARCWVQEGTLLEAIEEALPDAVRRATMGRLRVAWTASRQRTFTASMAVLAGSLARLARAAEPLPDAGSVGARLVAAGETLGRDARRRLGATLAGTLGRDAVGALGAGIGRALGGHTGERIGRWWRRAQPGAEAETARPRSAPPPPGHEAHETAPSSPAPAERVAAPPSLAPSGQAAAPMPRPPDRPDAPPTPPHPDRTATSPLPPASDRAIAAPLARAEAALVDRLDREVRASTAELIALHGLEGRAEGEILARVAEDFDARLAIHEGRAALWSGAVGGALAGLNADLLSGGLTLGGGLIAGGLLGALGGAGVARSANLARGTDSSSVAWSAAALDRLLEAALLRYLAVAHFGRGRGEWAQGATPPHWRVAVQQALVPHRSALAAAWHDARVAPTGAGAGVDADAGIDATARLERELAPLLAQAAAAALERLYPDAGGAIAESHVTPATGHDERPGPNRQAGSSGVPRSVRHR